MSWLSKLLGGDKPHTPRSLLHKLGWPEPSRASDAVVSTPALGETADEAAAREQQLKRAPRPDKPANRARRKPRKR